MLLQAEVAELNCWTTMFNYLLKRLLMMIPMLIGITLISFVVIHLAPGEPTDLQTDLNPKASAELRERLRERYHLDQPLPVQYGLWLSRLVRLDFGESFALDRRPVLDKIAERLPVTILINLLSIVTILAVAIPIGILSAVRRNSLFDRATTVFVFTGFAMPSFWLALLLMDYFGVRLGWFPIAGLRSVGHEYLGPLQQFWDSLHHLILPVFVSAFGGLAGFSRYMRSNMLDVIRQDYILTARAKGLSESQVICKHALRNALLPVITILGLSVPGLIGGSVIFETIFAIPGMGKLFYDGVMMRDYPLIMGILVIGAFLTLIGNLLADLGYALADPRIRRG
ncbi:MAG: ABC transporter permease [Desulfuromonadales bacterium]|nr:ABC transporter permease [Desulfuromonadales bacterium]